MPAKKLSRCPHCLTYMYDPVHGCQVCGYVARKRSSFPIFRFGVLGIILVLFAVWQLGFFPKLPYSGKAVQLLSGQHETKAAATAKPTEIPVILPLETSSASEAESALPIESTEATVMPADDLASAATAEPAVTITPTKAPFLCNGVTTRIPYGEWGGITPGGVSSNLRPDPSTEGASRGVLRPGMSFVVVSQEPVCSLGFLWIEVEVEETGQRGWTVEAKGSQYWLAPADNNG